MVCHGREPSIYIHSFWGCGWTVGSPTAFSTGAHVLQMLMRGRTALLLVTDKVGCLCGRNSSRSPSTYMGPVIQWKLGKCRVLKGGGSQSGVSVWQHTVVG